jgi:hypothetical protein
MSLIQYNPNMYNPESATGRLMRDAVVPGRVVEWSKTDHFVQRMFNAGLYAYLRSPQMQSPFTIPLNSGQKSFIRIPSELTKAQIPSWVMETSNKARSLDRKLNNRIIAWVDGFSASALIYEDTRTVVASLIAIAEEIRPSQ